MHKNFVGTALAFAAIVVYIRPDWVGWTQRLARRGALAADPRDPAHTIAAGDHRPHRRRHRRRDPARSDRALAPRVPADHPRRRGSSSRWWSTRSRRRTSTTPSSSGSTGSARCYAFWRESPVFGHGLRYWYTEPTAPYQPPQAEMEVLASAGIVGLIGFLVMWVGVLVVLWRVDPRFGTLAVAVTCSPHRAGAVRPVLGRRAGLDPLRDRGDLPRGDGAGATARRRRTPAAAASSDSPNSRLPGRGASER